MARGQTQQWTVVSDSDRITLLHRKALFTCAAAAAAVGGVRFEGVGWGFTPPTTDEKSCDNSTELPQPFFRNKKPQNPYLQILVFASFEQFS